MIQVIAAKFRENIRKETLAAMKNVAPGKVELVINATEPLVQKYVELITEIFGAMCTPSPAPPSDVPADANIEGLQREIARIRDVVDLKTDQVRILREQVLQIAFDPSTRRE